MMPSSKSPTIVIEDACVTYKQSILFDHLNLKISAEKITCLLGPSGIGKSTLLRLIAGLITPNEETLFTGKISSDTFTAVDQHVAYLAQTDLLLPWLTAIENALLGAKLRGKITTDIQQRSIELFNQVGLKNAENKFPHELSGGMRQRVALVRTLLEDKPIVLMDEPFSALDAITRLELQTLSTELLKNKTVLLVTHDPFEALRIADEIFVMSGQPALFSTHLSLTTSAPRNFSDAEVLKYQEVLYEALLKAKQTMSEQPNDN